jgi:hypothetical protein
MAVAAVAPRSFDFGGVFSSTFSVIGKNFVTFLVFAIIAEIPSATLVWFVIGANPFSGMRFVPPPGSVPKLYYAVLLGSYLLTFIFSCILQAALIYGTVITLNGRRASLIDCLRIGLGAFLPVLAIGILAAIGLAVGFILLIVPGVILMLGWWVAIPVRVIEKKPIFEVFGRSWNLTSGHRGTIFGIFVVIWIANVAMGFAIMPLASLSLVSTSAGGASILYVAASATIRILLTMFNATLAGVIYFELRSIKEGVGAEELASVFD